MAERRMLAKSIIDSDAFSDMPIESQMLYVRLNMAADDDGFVSNPRRIMRAGGFTDDSMKLLIAKKFVLSFEYGDSFVYLIKHWRIHNYIQRDRYKASTFKQLLREVYLDENKAYSLNPGPEKQPAIPLDTECIHDVSRMDTQVRLGKDRLDKVSLEQDRIVKGEYEGETPPPTPTAPADQPPMLTAEEKKEKIDSYVRRIHSFKQMGFDETCWYTLAASEGISREEIESELRSDTGGEADGNERSV